uniref:Glycosyltransferase RgtA/B/C/D-like domain-containing protein n=1 Tax=candidate division WOR-3 bacterium TaxID=2052148 RepID=A0A7C4YAY6_UNCW3
MNFLFFILSFIVFCLLLKEYNISPIFSLLLLLHPSVILYSRTLMSDIPSMFFILYGIYLILKEKKFLSGLVLGFSLLLRFSNAVIISGVLLYLFFNDRKNLHRFLPGIFIFILIQSFYNIFVMEGLFAPFLLPTGAGGLSIIYIKDIGLYYFISLNILYPLMLLVFILNLKNREYFLYTFPALITLFFFSFYYYIDKGNSFIETLVKGQRFMIPIIPLLLLIYSNSLNKLRYSKSMILLASFFLLIFDGGINYKMYSFQKEKGILKDIIYENTKDADIIICNGEVCKLFNPFFGSKRWINYVFDGKLSIKKEDFKKFNNIYLCFIESSKEKNAKEIFFDTLLTMFNTEKIIEIQKPSYLILVKVIKDW